MSRTKSGVREHLTFGSRLWYKKGMSTLQTQTAVITGASSGIGRAIALRLAEQGAFLHLVGRDQTRLEEVVEACRAAGSQADAHAADVGEDAQVRQLVGELEREVKGVDILVHSAGVVHLGPVAEAPVEKLDWQYRINLRAPFLLTQGLLPLLMRATGQVVFINSGAGLSANGNWSQYAASKHALRAFADSLRHEVKPHGLRVMSVYPGRTASPMQQQVREMEGAPYDPERFIQPDDVAQQVVSALALPRTADVTDLSIRPGIL
jgi:NAD(P)-dependent dehydrogenase (short-subunit alcohol dehydrogenase family)